jgi:hypothetical protein
VNEDQRQQWKRALAAKAAQQRRQQYRPRARGIQAVKGAGMVRVLPPQSERARTGQARSPQPKG